MQLKKLLQGSAFALVAAACAIAVPSVVKAADATGTYDESKVTVSKVDGVNAQMTAKVASGEKELLVGFAKVSKGKVTVPTWDTYDDESKVNAGVTIDLSKLSNTKENYIALTTPNALADDVITIVKIPAVKKVFKAEFDGATAAFSAGEADRGRPTLAKLDSTSGTNYEYRTAYSSWTNMVSSNKLAEFGMYQEEGANIFIRKVGTEQDMSSATQASDTYKFGANDKLKAYATTATLPGKEAKVVIKARAKGPSISGDYAKGTVKLPKKADYRIVGGTKVGDPVGVGDSPKTMTIAELQTAGSAAIATGDKKFSVEVRTAADPEKKKASSKWSRLSVGIPQKLAITAGVANTETKPTNGVYAPVAGGKTYGGKGVVLATGVNVSFKYIAYRKLAEYQQNNAIEIENKDEDQAYEIVVSSATAEAPAADAKVTKLAKGSGKKAKLTGVVDGSKVWIRVAGDKKLKTWLGAYTYAGPVDYEFKVPAPAAEGSGS